jgi:hypothetical protein
MLSSQKKVLQKWVSSTVHPKKRNLRGVHPWLQAWAPDPQFSDLAWTARSSGFATRQDVGEFSNRFVGRYGGYYWDVMAMKLEWWGDIIGIVQTFICTARTPRVQSFEA